jgi:uncharacterized protein (PEP-CTERM system associated)
MTTEVFFAQPGGLRKTVAAALLSLPFAMHVSIAHSQGVPEDSGEEPKRAGYWIEPRVSVGLSITNNSRLNADRIAEQGLSISPGFRAVFDNARVRGSLDYSLTGLYYARGTYDNSFQQALDGFLTINTWDDRAFVDIAGKVDRVAVSAFGGQSVNDFTNPNLSESAQVRVSPYLKGYLGSAASYEARYTLQATRTDVATRSDYTAHDWLISLENRDLSQRIGWSLKARTQKNDYNLGRTTQSRSAEAGLSYAFTPMVRGSAFVGAESNDVVSLDRRSYSASGVGVDWQPSDKTRISIALDRRYYGNGHNILLEHRSARTVWRYTDTQSAVNNALEDVAVFGGNFDVFANYFEALEPDPVKREQLIEREKIKYGVQSTYDLYRRFVTSSSTFERNQILSVLLEGARSVVTLSLGRHKSRRLDAGVNLLGDDFDNASSILQRSWAVVYAHRLTQLTSASVSLTGLKTDSTNASLGDSSKALGVGLTSRLGLRTSATVQLQHTVFTSAVNPYRVTSVVGVVTHRF